VRVIQQQVKILQELDHPNVVKIHKFFRSDPAYYYAVLDLVAGEELVDYIAKKVGGLLLCVRALHLFQNGVLNDVFFLRRMQMLGLFGTLWLPSLNALGAGRWQP